MSAALPTMPAASLDAGEAAAMSGSAALTGCSLCEALSKIKTTLSGVAAGTVELDRDMVYALANQHAVTQIIFLWTIYCVVGYVFNRVLAWAVKGTRFCWLDPCEEPCQMWATLNCMLFQLFVFPVTMYYSLVYHFDGNIFAVVYGKNPEVFSENHSDYEELFSYPMICLMMLAGYLFKDLVTICPGAMDWYHHFAGLTVIFFIHFKIEVGSGFMLACTILEVPNFFRNFTVVLATWLTHTCSINESLYVIEDNQNASNPTLLQSRSPHNKGTGKDGKDRQDGEHRGAQSKNGSGGNSGNGDANEPSEGLIRDASKESASNGDGVLLGRVGTDGKIKPLSVSHVDSAKSIAIANENDRLARENGEENSILNRTPIAVQHLPLKHLRSAYRMKIFCTFLNFFAHFFGPLTMCFLPVVTVNDPVTGASEPRSLIDCFLYITHSALNFLMQLVGKGAVSGVNQETQMLGGPAINMFTYSVNSALSYSSAASSSAPSYRFFKYNPSQDNYCWLAMICAILINLTSWAICVGRTQANFAEMGEARRHFHWAKQFEIRKKEQ